MSNNNRDGLNSLGWGTVAENAIVGKEDQILVFLNEQFPNSSGQLEVNPEIFTTSGNDSKGKHYTIRQNTESTITATFLNRDTNRITAPQVQKGERVLVYQFDNDKTYYWEPANLDNHKRVQEAVVHAYAAKKPTDGKDLVPTTPENSYTTTVDGINGLIEQRMTEANGEVSPWLTQYDAKNGNMVITDQKGNIIQINTKETTIEIVNADRSHIQLKRDVINIYSENQLNIEVSNEINIQTKTLNIKCDTYNHECSTYNHKADKVVWNANTVEMSGSEFTLNYPTINLVGQVNAGGLSVTGNGGSGNARIRGNTEVQGSQTIQGSVSIQGTLTSQGPVNFPSGGSISGYD